MKIRGIITNPDYINLISDFKELYYIGIITLELDQKAD
jgi:hypothetical protein